jgi:LysM repeat protein
VSRVTPVADVGGSAQPHHVQRGETLSHIAQRYGTSVEKLLAHNRIRNARRVRAGQIIQIPGSRGDARATDAAVTLLPAAAGGPVEDAPAGGSIGEDGAAAMVVSSAEAYPDGNDGYIHHRVRRGQTLSHIARQYGTSVGALKQHNGIRDARRVRAGQVIKVPRAPVPQDPAPDAGAEAERDGYVRHQGHHGQPLWQTAGRSSGAPDAPATGTHARR